MSCAFCSAQFPERSSLDMHTMTEHGEMMQLLAEEHLGKRALLYSSSFSRDFFKSGKSSFIYLKGLSYEIDFENVDEN